MEKFALHLKYDEDAIKGFCINRELCHRVVYMKGEKNANFITAFPLDIPWKMNYNSLYE